MFGMSPVGDLATMSVAKTTYQSIFCITLSRTIPKPRSHGGRLNSGWMLSLILVLHGCGVSLSTSVVEEIATTKTDMILDGLLISMVTSDILVAKMAGRDLHVWILIIASMVTLPHMQSLTWCCLAF